MSNGRGLSRGDKSRNARMVALRELLPREHAILALDLAKDKQVFALTDHDSRVLARRTVTARPWALAEAIGWGRDKAIAAGFASVTVVCEPTGHRWKSVAELTDAAGVDLVCVQPMLVARAREEEDFTRDKSDDKDAMIIARLASQLKVYRPERAEATWARLRHQGARREHWVTEHAGQRQQVRDLLECAWPAALEAAAKPLDSRTWLAALAVTGCDPVRIRRMGIKRLTVAVGRELPHWGGRRPCARIIRALHEAADDERGVPSQRPGGLERAAMTIADLCYSQQQIEAVEAVMTAVMTQLGIADLAASIPGVSLIGSGMILAETGDPTRFTSARALVKHAGLCPRENSSGAFTGKSAISRRGRPRLRAAAYRAAWGAVMHNPVMAARHQHLTTRKDNKLTDTQARVAVAASLLRQLYMVITTRTAWDPQIASAGRHGHDRQVSAPAA